MPGIKKGIHLVEVKMSGNGSPPDRQGGQHTNRSSFWVRINKGEYFSSPLRSLYRTVEEIANLEVEDDITEEELKSKIESIV